MLWIIPTSLLILSITYLLYYRYKSNDRHRNLKAELRRLTIQKGITEKQLVEFKTALDELKERQQTVESISRETFQPKVQVNNQFLSESIQHLKNHNVLLRSIHEKLLKLGPLKGKAQKDLSVVLDIIEKEMTKKEDWRVYLKQFKHKNPYLYRSIIQKHGDLSFNEWRLVALTKYGLSTAEIASLLNVSIEGVKKARHRLRKKLAINPTKDFRVYFEEL